MVAPRRTASDPLIQVGKGSLPRQEKRQAHQFPCQPALTSREPSLADLGGASDETTGEHAAEGLEHTLYTMLSEELPRR